MRTVGLAAGLSFPDALAAGPAVAAAGGSLLLVGATATPALAEELVRSDPEQVLVAGLAGAVPAGVVAQVSGCSPHCRRERRPRRCASR